MKGKQILIAFIALVLLSAYFYFFSYRKKQDEQKAKDASMMLFPAITSETVSDAVIKTSDGVIKLKKSGDNWDMISPLQVPADKNLVHAIIAHVTSAKAERKIEGAVLADYGLNTPPVYVEMHTKYDKSGTLYLSGMNPTGTMSYCYREGDNTTVYLVEKNLRSDCDKTIKDFRYKGLLRHDEKNMTKIEVNLKDKKYIVEKEGDDWYMTSPFRKLAKKDRTTIISNNAINSNIKNYFDAAEAGKYGLANPSEYIKIYEGKKENDIYFGKADRKNSTIFARTSFQPGIIEIPDFIYKDVAKFDEILNKQVLIFKQDDVAGLSVDYGDKSIKAVRNAPEKRPDWLIKESKGIDSKSMGNFNAGTLISALFWIEYRQAIKNPDSLKEASEYGLSPAVADINMVDKDGKVIGKLQIGAKNGNDEDYLKNTGNNTVYTVPESSVKNMGVPGLELK